MFRTLLVIGTALMLFGWSPATAQTRAAAKACAKDIAAQCGKVQPGGAMKQCMTTHFKDLSQRCQAAIQQAQAVMKGCAGDIKQHCAAVKPGGTRIERCLQTHLMSLSDGCKAAISGTTAAGKS